MKTITTEEAIENIVGYAQRILNLQLQKKAIDKDIKAVKDEFKEEGVAVGKVTKVLTKLKAKAKMSEADKFEEDLIEDALEKNEDVQNSIAELNTK